MIVKSYGYKVSRRPSNAGVDPKTQLFLPSFPGGTVVGTVLKVEPCEETGLKHLMMWTVDMEDDEPAPEKPADVVAMQAATVLVELPIEATCSWVIERD